MKSFKEIKRLFENRDYFVRSEFINEYDFSDRYFGYYRKFILGADNIKGHLYLSDLIDLSGWLGIYDKKLRDRWLSYLFEPKHYIVKLAVLDYFKFCNKKILDSKYERKLKMLLGRKLQSIIRCQALFNLISYNPKTNWKYVEILNVRLAGAKDWKIFHRIINNIKEVEIDSKAKAAICNHLKELSTKIELGSDTLKLLEDAC